MPDPLTSQMSLMDLEITVLLRAGDPPVKSVADVLARAHALAREVVCSTKVMPHAIEALFRRIHQLEEQFFPGVHFSWDLPEGRVWDDDLLWSLGHSDTQTRTSRMGRPPLVRQGGDWTPQILKAEMDRRKLSQRQLGELFDPKLSDVAIFKWLKHGIPDSRQAQLTTIFKQLDLNE